MFFVVCGVVKTARSSRSSSWIGVAAATPNEEVAPAAANLEGGRGAQLEASEVAEVVPGTAPPRWGRQSPSAGTRHARRSRPRRLRQWLVFLLIVLLLVEAATYISTSFDWQAWLRTL